MPYWADLTVCTYYLQGFKEGHTAALGSQALRKEAIARSIPVPVRLAFTVPWYSSYSHQNLCNAQCVHSNFRRCACLFTISCVLQLARWILERACNPTTDDVFEAGPYDLPLHQSLQLDGHNTGRLNLPDRKRPTKFLSAGWWDQATNTIWAVKTSEQPIIVRTHHHVLPPVCKELHVCSNCYFNYL